VRDSGPLLIERVAILGTAQRFQIALGNRKILVLQDPEVSSTPMH
jgi:hypothetical protein